MAKLSDLWKKGSGAPTPANLVQGGFGVDIVNKRIYSKAQDDTIFEITAGKGVITIEGENQIEASGTINFNQDSDKTIKIKHKDTSTVVNQTNTGTTVVQNVKVDSNGHTTELSYVRLPAILNGTGTPSNAIGTDGDLYVRY